MSNLDLRTVVAIGQDHVQEEIKRLAQLRVLLMQEEGVIASQRRDCEKQIVELQVNLLDQRATNIFGE